MNHFDIVGVIACKVLHNLSSCDRPRVRKCFVSLLMTLLHGQYTRESFLKLVVQILKYRQHLRQ